MNSKVICYYEPLNTILSKDSKRLVDMWKCSWSNNGWDPIVLCKKDAEEYTSFEELNLTDPSNPLYQDSQRDDHLLHYRMSCYYRLVAYCNYVLNKGPALYADYDVMNYSFTVKDYNEYDYNTVLGCGSSVVKLDRVGACDILRAIQKGSEDYTYDKVKNDMRCVRNKTTCFTWCRDIYNDILKDYEECKVSKFVHYHNGYKKHTPEKRFNTSCRSDFIKRFRPITNK